MESGWLVNSSFSSSEGAAAAKPERSYQISPIVLSSRPALLQGRGSTTPQGFGKECAIACSMVITLVSFRPRQWLSRRIQDAPTALERAALCTRARPRGQIQARMDDRACRWHRRCQLDEAETSVRRRFFLQLGQVTDLPVASKWGRKCKAQWQMHGLNRAWPSFLWPAAARQPAHRACHETACSAEAGEAAAGPTL